LYPNFSILNLSFSNLKTDIMISSIFWIVPVAALMALLFAWIFYRSMKAQDEGTDRMKEIALYVREGAMAYLNRQYSVVGKVFIILIVLLAILAYFGIQNPFVPVAFLTGGFFSGLFNSRISG